MTELWRRCSACKKDIALGAVYWVCSVSTCNRKRTGLAFCTVDCWEIHLPTERHREAWAIEKRAPLERPDPKAPPVRAKSTSTGAEDDAILVVASRLKSYIRARAGYNTSDGVLPLLSDHLRTWCNQAIRHARAAGRETVLDRDVPEED